MHAMAAACCSLTGPTSAPLHSPARCFSHSPWTPSHGTAAAHAGVAWQQRCTSGVQHPWHARKAVIKRTLQLAALPAGGPQEMCSIAQSEAFLSNIAELAAQHAALYTLETLIVGVAAYAAAVWPSRPRGWCFKELVTVRPSPVAGLGVFATVHIQAGTVLGAYPGRPRTPAQMAQKCQTATAAAGYCFRTRSGMLLDPTDASGRLSAAPAPGLPWLPIDFILAFVNEPPRGAGGTNVSVEDDPGDDCGLLCVAARDIYPGEELYMDYGVHYDRSGYSRAADTAPDTQKEEARTNSGGKQE